MENLRDFLESSTIHGLVYISTNNKKFVRIFWILTVISGFSGAGYLIYEYFKDWAESPVKTSTENMPIKDITFPKVTVCPPKNTFTDLNYDLEMTEEIALENETIRELTYYLQELLFDHLHNKFMINLQKLQDNETFYNWYHGYSELLLHITDDIYNHNNDYRVNTTATSGTMNSQYFGSRFVTKFDQNTSYRVYIYPPESVRDNTNVALHFNMQWIQADDFSGERFYINDGAGQQMDSNKFNTGTSFEYKLSPPTTWRSSLDSVSVNMIRGSIERFKEIKNMQQEKMPGFKLTWFYSGMAVVPEVRYHDNVKNKAFKRW